MVFHITSKAHDGNPVRIAFVLNDELRTSREEGHRLSMHSRFRKLAAPKS